MSKKYRNFADYLQDVYYNEIFSSVKSYVLTHKNSINLRSYTVIDASYVQLEDIRVRGVTFRGDEGHIIFFSASVEADIVLKGMGRHDYEADHSSQWFSVSFLAQLLEGIRDVNIVDVDSYSKEKFDKESSLSQYLIPYIYAEDLDKAAEKFLSDHFPEALERPMPIDVDELTDNLCLEKYYAPLPDNIFGKSYFSDATAKVYSADLSEIHEQPVTRGTILINPNACFMRNIGSENNTIIHECIHQEVHDKFFELQKLLAGNTEITAICCEVTDCPSSSEEGLKKALHWMEWQANALAPRIQMPKTMALKKIYEILTGLNTEYPGMGPADLMQEAVSQFAKFYQVSHAAAKIRLVQLGYPQAVGTFIYRNGHPLKPYSFADGALQKGETFEISEKDVLFFMATKPEFMQLIQNELFVYADGMICIKDSLYIDTDDCGCYHLSEHARNHADECCLVFKVRNFYSEKEYDDSFYRECYLCRDVNANTFVETEFDPLEGNTQSKEERAKECKKIKEQVLAIQQSMNAIPSTFAGTLKYHMDRKAMDPMALSITSYLSEQAIINYLKDKVERPQKNSVLALCVGLNLNPIYSIDLFTKAGYDLYGQKSEENSLYIYLIYNHPMETIDQWNEKLKIWGLPAIPTKNK